MARWAPALSRCGGGCGGHRERQLCEGVLNGRVLGRWWRQEVGTLSLARTGTANAEHRTWGLDPQPLAVSGRTMPEAGLGRGAGRVSSSWRLRSSRARLSAAAQECWPSLVPQPHASHAALPLPLCLSVVMGYSPVCAFCVCIFFSFLSLFF